MMGSLSIEDMARFVAPGCDVVETGLRSCEKLHEDLLHPDEPAVVNDGWFWINGLGATTGHRYTSEIAPRLTRDQFLAMLSEAEADA